MNCNDCCYNLPKDGHSYCTYEEGECVKISMLEKENAELDCQKNRNKFCYSCANAEDRCFRNEIGCPCGKYKSYKDENAELKIKIKHLTKHLEPQSMTALFKQVEEEFEQEQRIKELQQENEELKRGYYYEAEVINGRPTGKAILVPDNLAYAKSIIKDLLNNSDEYAKQRAREFLEDTRL